MNTPIIKLTSMTPDGNYYGAYKTDEDKHAKYLIFVSFNEEKEKSYCTCMSGTFGNPCYHLEGATARQEMLFN